MARNTVPPTTTATAKKVATLVSNTVTHTLRKPTSPNHNQLTYMSTSCGPTSSNMIRPRPTIISRRARLDKDGSFSGERVPMWTLRSSGGTYGVQFSGDQRLAAA